MSCLLVYYFVMDMCFIWWCKVIEDSYYCRSFDREMGKIMVGDGRGISIMR